MCIRNGAMPGTGLALQAQRAAGSVRAEQWAWLCGAHTYTCLVQAGVPNRVVGLESGLGLGAASSGRISNSDGSSCRSGGEVTHHTGEVLAFKLESRLTCISSEPVPVTYGQIFIYWLNV